MSIGTRLYTLFFGQFVGEDQFGNRYYRRRGGAESPGRFGREARWVLYKGEPEASKVPPEWHGWLHSTTDDPPKPGERNQRPWQKEHVPNLTGTPYAYRPEGHTLRGGHRAKATGDYEPWVPS